MTRLKCVPGSSTPLPLLTLVQATPPSGFAQPAAAVNAAGLGGLGGEQAKIHDIKAAQARSALDHEQFFKGLEEAADGFGHVASYFGKGVMS